MDSTAAGHDIVSIDGFTPDRRRFLAAAGVGLLLLPLAACQTARSRGESARKSAAAVPRLARLRKEHDLPALRADRNLETAALRQAGYMAGAGVMEHKTGLGRDFVSRMKDVDTNGTAAENIARGRFDLDRVLTVWMHSPPHRRNILDPRFSRFGLAYVTDGDRSAARYWAMVLGA
jgi:uncharacterized protein YkwD